MIKCGKKFNIEDCKRLNESKERFKEVMNNSKRMGQVIAIDFKKKKIIKHKCHKGKLAS